MAHDLTQTRIFDVNGSKYRVGMDEHGYVQIQTGEMYYDEEAEEDTFWPYEKDADVPPHVMADPATARAMAEYITEIAQ